MFPSRVPTSNRSRRLALALVAAAFAVPATSASAASVSLKIADPAGDSTGGSSLDITGATLAQDTGTGNVSASVSFGAAPQAGAAVAVGLGKMSNGACSVGVEGDGSLIFLVVLDTQPSGLWAIGSDSAPHPVTPTVSGSTLKLASGSSAVLKKLAWNCGTVSIQLADGDSGESKGDTATASGTGLGAAQTVVLTDKPDGDKDGVPDVADACPTVAGASANGCLTIAAKLALRLGAKRVAIDMLVPQTGTTCAATAKATVKQGRKTLGKGNLTVGVHGSFCHITGAVKIKKHGKAVKIKIAGTGFKAVSATVKK